MLQKNRNVFQGKKERRKTRFNYPEVISIALKQESMGRRDFAIAVANWTGASDRTVVNWLNGESGPNGAYLIYLMRRSDEVLKMVLALAQRQEILETFYEHEKIRERERQSTPDEFNPSNRLFSPAPVPVRVPDDTDDVPDPYAECGVRQKWFLSQLAANRDVRAEHIANVFSVSIKTGKRDIAALKDRKAIVYAGSTRRGRYRLVA